MFPLEEQFARIRRVWDKNLFFIAATEKSGTTWLQLMLDAHPQVACRGEGLFSTTLIPEVRKALDTYSSELKRINETVFGETGGFPLPTQEHRAFLQRSLMSLIMAEYGDRLGVVALGEKTPDNIRQLRTLRYLFPEARFILMVRDGRDIAVSGWFHVKRQWGEERGAQPLGPYARRIARLWRQDIANAKSFSDEFPESCIWVRYEDMLPRTEFHLSRILGFLGADARPEVVKACTEAGDFKTLTKGRERGQEDKTSHFRKGIAGDWRNHFDEAAIKAFNEEAGDVLRGLGYGA